MADQRGCYYVDLLPGVGNAGCLDLPNPEEVDLIVTRVLVTCALQATGGARDLNVGIGAAGADNNNLFAAAAAATGLFEDHMRIAGAGTGTARVWGAAQSLTVTPSADAAGQVAALYVEYIRV